MYAFLMLKGEQNFEKIYKSLLLFHVYCLLYQLSYIINGAKLGDATVARAPPLLSPPRKFIV